MTKLEQGINDLATINPELAKQWHPTKNGDLKSSDVLAGSKKKVWWLLPYDDPETGKHFDFEWDATVSNRAILNSGCPYLTGNLAWKGFNDLVTINPQLAKEWHPTRNKNLKNKFGRDVSTPDKVTVNSHQRVWWYLPYDIPMDYPIEHLRGKHFDFEWEADISNRTSCDSGCPYLTGNGVWRGFNDLSTTDPDLAKEWHPTKNIGITPTDVTAGSNKKIWWLLPYDVPLDYPVEHLRGKHFDFEWEDTISHRLNDGRGCPYLSGHGVWKGFNDLATTNPDIATEWHPTKNGKLTPQDITAGSHKKVWWHLPYEDPKTGEHFDFEWEATVNNRNKGRGCPFILSSKGEILVRKILKSNNINFEEQYTFKDRFITSSKHLLKDDFAIFDKYGNVVATIEFHGLQHYEPVDFAGRGKKWAEEEFNKNQIRDKIKTDYLKSHNIKQLIIPYTKFDEIEKIVSDFIQDISNKHELFSTKEQIGTIRNVEKWIPPNQNNLDKKQVKNFVNNVLNNKQKNSNSNQSKKPTLPKNCELDVNL